ncbi:MAG: PorV/PorQ family protein [Fidelibacterota bacterium]
MIRIEHKQRIKIVSVISIAIFISCLITTPLFGQGTLFPILGGQRAGTSVFSFLKIGIGARAAAMGEAFVGVANDASTLYWNPAGAVQIGRNELTLEKTQWPVDIQYDYLGYVHRTGAHTALGISLGYLYTDPMEITTEYQPNGTGEYFAYSDFFAGLTLSQSMTDRFSFGITLKYVEENMARLIMRTGLIDIGTFYWTGYKTLKFCVSLVNFGPQARPEGTFMRPTREGGEEEVRYQLFSPPTIFRIGSSMNIFESSSSRILLALQLNHPVDNTENFVGGIEYSFKEQIFLRAGWKAQQAEETYTFGAGLRLNLRSRALRVDYSYTDFGRLNMAQRFQISLEL